MAYRHSEYRSEARAAEIVKDIDKTEIDTAAVDHIHRRSLRRADVNDAVRLASIAYMHYNVNLIYCYKIVFGLIKLNFSDFFEFSSLTTRGHAYKLYSQEVLCQGKFFRL